MHLIFKVIFYSNILFCAYRQSDLHSKFELSETDVFASTEQKEHIQTDYQPTGDYNDFRWI